MANRPKGFGMTAELANKKAAKFDPETTEEALQWLADVLKHAGGEENVKLADSLSGMSSTQKDVQVPLKDGKLLCTVINIVKPGSVKKINTGAMAFKQMENISNYLAACEGIGMSKTDQFQTVDLYEANNIPQVVCQIFAFGRKAQKIGFEGPTLGPAESNENKREFTEEQLNAGKNIIGLQAGTNKCASQAGQNFGKTRSIVD
jgi:hypothetical protein